MGRPPNPKSNSVHIQSKIPRDLARFIDGMVESADLPNRAEVVRFALETLAEIKRGEVIVIGGRAAVITRRLAHDLGVDGETAVLIATHVAASKGNLDGDLDGMIGVLKAARAVSPSVARTPEPPGRP